MAENSLTLLRLLSICQSAIKSERMKKIVLFATAALCSLSLLSQEVLFFEDFETGGGTFDLNTSDEGGISASSGANQWIVNSWYTEGFGTDTDCSFGDLWCQPVPAQDSEISSTDGNYLHTYSDLGNDFCFNQNCNIQSADAGCSGEESYFASMSADVSTVGYTDVTLDFWWLCEGSSFAYGELWYSTDGGSSWTEYTISPDYEGQLTWANEVVSDPAWGGQSTLRFGFRFVNEFDFSGYNNLIGWGIDDVSISATEGSGCSDTFSSFTVTSCGDYTVPSGDETYSTDGVYNDTIPNVDGCDSVMTITVAITELDLGVSYGAEQFLISDETASGVTYQWLDCDNANAVIPGETNDTLDALPYGPGDYAVVVSNGSCTDTSDCIFIGLWSIDENPQWSFLLYPNPVSNKFGVVLNGKQQFIRLEIMDVMGKVVFDESYWNVSEIQHLDTPNEAGVYFVRLEDEQGRMITKRLIKK